jgi:hypothetical protein
VLPPVDPHDPQWVSINWTTDRKVCHVPLHLLLAWGGAAADYTSFQVDADNGGKFLTATVDYDYCQGDSPTMNDAIGFWLPVRA